MRGRCIAQLKRRVRKKRYARIVHWLARRCPGVSPMAFTCMWTMP